MSQKKIKNISPKIKNLFKLSNINICFRADHSARRFLFSSKDHTPKLEKSGVYQLSCCDPDYKALYVGQTGRKYSTRISEHVKEFNIFTNNPNFCKANMKSPFSRPLCFHHHPVNIEEGFKVLHFCEKGNLLDLLESLKIARARRNSPFFSKRLGINEYRVYAFAKSKYK